MQWEDVVSLQRMLLGALAAMSLGFMSVPAFAGQDGPGVSDTEIKIGNTMPYSGPASGYGAIGKSLAAYFAMINDQGGINGRKINFISRDDGYSPAKTVEQVRKLVEEEQVLLMFQTLGTAPNLAIRGYLNDNKIPQLFVGSGADQWNDPKHYPWTMGWQPNYGTESRIYARYILDNLPDARIAVLYQNDDFGKDYVNGLRAGLGEKAGLIVATLSYETTDPTVDSQVVALQASGASVLLTAAIPKFTSLAIRKVYDIGWRPTHFINSVSTSVGSVMKPAGIEKAVGVISGAFNKDPSDPQWQDTAEYAAWLAWMKKYNPSGNVADTLTVYGNAAAQTMVAVLKASGSDLSRDNVMKQAASIHDLTLPMLLPGITISTSADDYATIKQMQLQKFDGTTWKVFGGVMTGLGN
jgi:ABC-type branched-subunit amino acid transport system substrate-binding protein